MNNKQFDYLDLIQILSLIIGVQSYELAQRNLIENREQTKDTQEILNQLEYHLKQQDDILKNQDKILFKLNGKEK